MVPASPSGSPGPQSPEVGSAGWDASLSLTGRVAAAEADAARATSVAAAAIAIAVLLLAFAVWAVLKLRALEGRMAMATLGGGTTSRRALAAQTMRAGAAHHGYTAGDPAPPPLDAEGYVRSEAVSTAGLDGVGASALYAVSLEGSEM